jgi:hypothetical protein
MTDTTLRMASVWRSRASDFESRAKFAEAALPMLRDWIDSVRTMGRANLVAGDDPLDAFDMAIDDISGRLDSLMVRERYK